MPLHTDLPQPPKFPLPFDRIKRHDPLLLANILQQPASQPPATAKSIPMGGILSASATRQPRLQRRHPSTRWKSVPVPRCLCRSSHRPCQDRSSTSHSSSSVHHLGKPCSGSAEHTYKRIQCFRCHTHLPSIKANSSFNTELTQIILPSLQKSCKVLRLLPKLLCVWMFWFQYYSAH